jgi:7-cyano-7-deazaguanine synthase in queuosine biosynthesis
MPESAARAMPKAKPAKGFGTATVAPSPQDECSFETTVFDKYEINFSAKAIRYSVQVIRKPKIIEPFGLSIVFHEALPESWKTDPPSRLLMGLGMAVISHVWTGFCTPTIIVRAGWLSPDDVRFWQDVYTYGLCEHFLINQIESLDGRAGGTLIVDIRVDVDSDESKTTPQPAATASAAPPPAAAVSVPKRVMVPVGGGKDSATVLQLMRKAGVAQVVPFFLADPTGEWQQCWRYRAVCAAAGTEAPCIVDFDWPSANYQRFHAIKRSRPGMQNKWDNSARLWAALCAFTAATAALVRDCEYVAVGNERSANLGNGVSWGGHVVNHQYDKSFAFEARAHAYLRPCGVYYFSALMHLWDVQVVEHFCRLARAFVPLIISCNEPLGRANSRWCGQCEKCAFVFAMLSAFLSLPHEAMAVWGDDLLETTEIFPRFDELCGRREQVRLPDGRMLPGRLALQNTPPGPESRCLRYCPGCDSLKPLDCVGTVEEAKLALWLARRRRLEHMASGGGGGGGLPKYFSSHGPWKQVQAELDRAPEASLALLDEWNDDNLLPSWLEPTCRELFQERVRVTPVK